MIFFEKPGQKSTLLRVRIWKESSTRTTLLTCPIPRGLTTPRLTKFFSSVKVCCEVPESQMWVLASFSSAFLTWGASVDVDVDVKLACVRKVPTSESAGTSRSASQCFSSDFVARAAIGGSSLRLPRLASWPAGCDGLLSGLGRFGRSLGCRIQHSFSL